MSNKTLTQTAFEILNEGTSDRALSIEDLEEGNENAALQTLTKQYVKQYTKERKAYSFDYSGSSAILKKIYQKFGKKHSERALDLGHDAVNKLREETQLDEARDVHRDVAGASYKGYAGPNSKIRVYQDYHDIKTALWNEVDKDELKKLGVDVDYFTGVFNYVAVEDKQNATGTGLQRFIKTPAVQKELKAAKKGKR